MCSSMANSSLCTLRNTSQSEALVGQNPISSSRQGTMQGGNGRSLCLFPFWPVTFTTAFTKAEAPLGTRPPPTPVLFPDPHQTLLS